LAAFYVSEETIVERGKLLLSLARNLLSSGVIPQDAVELAEHRFPLISEGYFLLNKAYKGWRIHNGHYTERPKIAAIQTVVISRLQPFFPKKLPVDQTNVAVIKCNEILGFTYALGILERDFHPDSPQKIDFWLRVLDIISGSSAETIEPYIQDKKFQINRTLDSYEASMGTVNERDKPAINSLICIFELISDKAKHLLD
jgi:hypothetical protein